MVAKNFADYDGLVLADVKKEISFDVTSDDAITQDNRLDINRKMLLRSDNNTPIGLVNKKRGILQYGQIMDWVTNELTNTGVDFKLRDSKLDKHANLYQEYLLDSDHKGPDGELISPLMLLRASYTGMPLLIEWGTYRFVCSNGVKVGQTLESLRVRPSQLDGLLDTSIVGDIQVRMDRFAQVLDKYKDLESQKYDPLIAQMLLERYIPMLMKKHVMAQLAEDGNIELTVDKLKGEHLNGAVDALYTVLQEQTAWYLYNVMTSIATHDSRTVNGRIWGYHAISKFFGV